MQAEDLPVTRSHQSLVAAQFGAHAQAYLTSEAHARGADLDRLTARVGALHPERVLDLGCGGGHVSFTLAPLAGQVVAYDLTPDMLATVRNAAADRGLLNIVTEQGAAESLPFPDASFDLVVSRYSAHHWHDLAAGLAGIRRVLKPGGLAIVMDVVSPGEALRDTFLQAVELLRDPSHVRDYAPSEWARFLRTAGLQPSEPIMDRLRLDFAAWIARIGTPDLQAQAIRALQGHMPESVARHFAIEADGTFTVDTMTMEARV